MPLAERALDAGLAVVVDKPLAPSAAEAAALVEHARASGKLLTVFHNRRWDSDHRTLRKLLAAGDARRRPALRVALRALAAGAAGRCVARDRRAGGGRRRPARPRQLTSSTRRCSCSGRRAHVYAEIDNRRGSPGDDDAFLALRHRSGAYSHLWMSALAAAPGPRLRVLGSRAAYVVAEVDGQEDALRSGRRPDDPGAWGVEPESRWGRLVQGEESEPVPSEPGAWPAFYTELERALREGGPPPVDPADAVAVLEVLDARSPQRSVARRNTVRPTSRDTSIAM